LYGYAFNPARAAAADAATAQVLAWTEKTSLPVTGSLTRWCYARRWTPSRCG